MGRKLNFDAMSVDEMWQLHEKISRVLSARLNSEKRQLERRLAQLRSEIADVPSDLAQGRPPKQAAPGRRKYPKVLPKYQNPNEPSETWSGRGKQPRWLVNALREGCTLEEFLMDQSRAPKSLGKSA